MDDDNRDGGQLKRSLSLPLLVLYGLGTTIGAGIYVLVGAAAGHAGMYVPIAFVVAVLGIIPTAMSFAEFAGRLPVSAGEAAFARTGFRSGAMASLTGGLVIASGLVSSATIALGCAGYVTTFIDLPIPVIATAVVVIMGIVAIWGIMESVILAALFTLIETGGLLILIYFGFSSGTVDLSDLDKFVPPVSDVPILLGIMNAGLMAVFAFIGFEDLVNVAEETIRPERSLPKAIFYTLGITTVLYALVSMVAVSTISPNELATSDAPLSLVFHKLTGWSPLVISGIAIFATANTILVQFIMVARVIYGMASRSTRFKLFGRVDKRTRTPLIATILVVVFTLILALGFPLVRLAETTSQIILLVWVIVNVALILTKLRQEKAPPNTVIVPFWVPVVGALLCGLFFVLSFLS